MRRKKRKRLELVTWVIDGETRPGCGKKTKKGKRRKHTPIVSKKQQKLFGAVAGGKRTKATGLSKAEAKRHLRESKGKDLPEYVAQRKAQKKRRAG